MRFRLSTLFACLFLAAVFLGVNILWVREGPNTNYVKGYVQVGDVYDPELAEIRLKFSGWPCTIYEQKLQTVIPFIATKTSLALPVEEPRHAWDWTHGIPINASCGLVMTVALGGLLEWMHRRRMRQNIL